MTKRLKNGKIKLSTKARKPYKNIKNQKTISYFRKNFCTFVENIMILAIDTSDSKKIKLALYWPQKMSQKLEFTSTKVSQNLLIEIDKFIKKNKIKLTHLKLIAINTGPGSFTGLRVGSTIANTLAYVLKIPAIGIKDQKNILKLAQIAYKKLYNNQISKNNKTKPNYDFNIK